MPKYGFGFNPRSNRGKMNEAETTHTSNKRGRHRRIVSFCDYCGNELRMGDFAYRDDHDGEWICQDCQQVVPAKYSLRKVVLTEASLILEKGLQ